MNYVIDLDNYPFDQWAGNVDGSGGINIQDVILLHMYVFDPDANPLTCEP